MYKFLTKNLYRGALPALVAGALMTSMMSEAAAQSKDRLRQGLNNNKKQVISLKAKDDVNISTDETQIFPSLTGLVITNDPKEIKDSGASATGVETTGDVVPQEVVSAAEAYIGQPVSLASLDRLTRDMVLAFREAGLPVVNVVVPPQDVVNNTVQIIAVVGRLGELTVEGDTADADYYTNDFDLNQGDVVNERVVINHLRWKSRRANRRVDAIYSPGSSFSQTDIALDVKETKPWSVFLGADSTGIGSSGDLRIFAGFLVNDVLTQEDEFSYQFTTSEHGWNELNGHVFQYITPVASRTDLILSAAFTESEIDAVGGGSAQGESTQINVAFLSQLDSDFGGFYWDARYGFEYKDTDNASEFGGIATPGAETQLGQFYVLFDGERSNADSRTNVFGGVYWGPGDMFGKNNDEAFGSSRAGSSADYVYFRGGVEYTRFLDNDWIFNLEVEGQYSADRLLGSELIYLGGINTIRGFDENVISGDHGIFARLELIAPAISFSKDTEVKDQLRGFAFFDVGAVEVEGTPIPNVEGNASISGAGIGLRYSFGDNLFAEAAYGWKVDDAVTNTRDPDDGEFHFRITTRY